MNSMFFVTKWLFLGMRWLYNAIESSTGWQIGYVALLTIFLATLAIKAITVFSDIASRKSSIKMQDVQPDLQKLQKKYGSDPQRLNVEQRKLMKSRGVSTLGGCLPMLVMWPLFFMFFSAFRAWSNETVLELLLTLSKDPEAGVEMFNSYKCLWIVNIWRPDNLSASVLMSGSEFWTMFTGAAGTGCGGCNAATNIENFLYFQEHQQELTELLVNMGFYVQNASTGVMEYAADSSNFIAAYDQLVSGCVSQYDGLVNGYAILPILAGGISFLSMWLTTKNTPAPAEGQPNTGKIMMYVMPFFMAFICWSQNATFSLYLIFSYGFSLIVTLILNHTMLKKPKDGSPNKKEVIKA